MVRVKLENVTEKFGSLVAVDNLSLEVKDKEFACLLGPSGAGKTTALRCIAGLERQDEGNIYIDDTLINDIPPAKRDIAMVFQSYASYPNMNVYDNLAFPLRMRKIPENEAEKRVKEVAETLHISHLLSGRIAHLSGGERQRVALGGALVRRPRLFLLDEPLTNLDAKLRAEMRVELKRLQREVGQTTIFATPDQLEAITMADRIAVMDHGKLLQYGTPDEVYRHPKNLFVAGFVGSPSMNFIDCTFVEKDEKAFLDTGTFSIDVLDFRDMVAKQASGPELILGIRPEDIKVAKERTPGSIKTEVYTIEPMGYEMVIDLKIGDRIFKALESAALKVYADEKVWIFIEKEKIYLFDKKTKQAIL